MNAEEATGMFTIGASFLAETGGEAGIEKRKFVFVDNFVHVVTGDRHFGSSDKSEIFPFDVVLIALFGDTWSEASTFEYARIN